MFGGHIYGITKQSKTILVDLYDFRYCRTDFWCYCLLTTAQVAAKDNTLLTPYDIISKVQIVIFLLYMLYRIVVLYKVEKRMVPMVMGIILVLAFVLNNIPSICGSISLISAVVDALTFVLWIYDIKLIFLDEKDKSSEATEN